MMENQPINITEAVNELYRNGLKQMRGRFLVVDAQNNPVQACWLGAAMLAVGYTPEVIVGLDHYMNAEWHRLSPLMPPEAMEIADKDRSTIHAVGIAIGEKIDNPEFARIAHDIMNDNDAGRKWMEVSSRVKRRLDRDVSHLISPT